MYGFTASGIQLNQAGQQNRDNEDSPQLPPSECGDVKRNLSFYQPYYKGWQQRGRKRLCCLELIRFFLMHNLFAQDMTSEPYPTQQKSQNESDKVFQLF